MAIHWIEWLPYIQDAAEHGTKLVEIAKRIGVNKGTVSAAITRLRKKGHKIPDLGTDIEGSIREKLIKGIVYRYQKIGGKWKLLGQKEGQVTKRIAARRTKEEKKAVRDRYLQMKPKKLVHMKREEKKLPTRIIDSNSMKTITVDSRTKIQIPADKDPDIAIQEWRKRYNKQ